MYMRECVRIKHSTARAHTHMHVRTIIIIASCTTHNKPAADIRIVQRILSVHARRLNGKRVFGWAGMGFETGECVLA